MLRAPLLALIACASLLLACRPAPQADALALPETGVTSTPGPSPTSTPAPTVTPSPEPTAVPAIDPAHIWVNAGAAAGSHLASVAPDGTVTTVRLPLDEGQTAGSIIAAADGSALAYLVWDEDGSQQGIAVWPLAEDDDRLVVQPGVNARIVALTLAADAQRLAYVEVEEDVSLAEAGWTLRMAPVSGGESAELTGRGELGDVTALVPFAWPRGGPMLLSPVVPGESSLGIVAVNAETGDSRLLLPADDEVIIGAPQLSPRGTQLAYVTGPAGEPGAAVARVHDLRLGRTSTVTPPPDTTLLSVRWHPDGERLLLDVTAPSPADDGGLAQAWALVDVEQPEDWQMSPPELRDGLFDYAPLGDGVAYTLSLDGSACELAVQSDILSSAAQSVTLNTPANTAAQRGCAPFIIHVP